METFFLTLLFVGCVVFFYCCKCGVTILMMIKTSYSIPTNYAGYFVSEGIVVLYFIVIDSYDDDDDDDDDDDAILSYSSLLSFLFLFDFVFIYLYQCDKQVAYGY